MKTLIKNLILNTPLESFARKTLRRPPPDFVNSSQYWDDRYRRKGNSGAGSYGRLASFKAEILNDFVVRNQVNSVIEFGCGDGNQLGLAYYPSYIGVDVSQASVELCIDKFSGDQTKRFFTTADYAGETAELSMSLDVIYHLVEDDVFDGYMARLFDAGSRFVAIYSSNHEDPVRVSHVRHRRFTDWVTQNARGFQLMEHIPNRYPFDEHDPDQTSSADFYLYKRS
jgi:SAM-dependent methyltransferase